MLIFRITVRTAVGDYPYNWVASSSGEAAEQVAGMFDEPCGVTVHERIS